MFNSLLVLNQTTKTIDSVDIVSGKISTLTGGLDRHPDGLVRDPHSGVIYWTNMGVGDPVRTPIVDSADAEKLLDFHSKDGSLEAVNADGTGRQTVLPPGALTTGKQIAAIFSQGRLYWSDREGARLSSVNIDGTGLRDLIVTRTKQGIGSILDEPVGVAVDPEFNSIFWTQKGPPKGGLGRIFRAGLNIPPGQRADARNDIETLWSFLPEPIDLELDTENRYLYWTDRGREPEGNTLNRAPVPLFGYAGEKPEILAGGLKEPIGLAVDSDAQVVYVGSLAGIIRAVSFDGSSDRIVTECPGQVFTGLIGLP